MVALGGVGYAAVKLPKNSVGTKQVKKNAITTAKIKKDAVTGAKVKAASLTGADIDVNSLGTVPSANAISNSLVAAEPTHLVGAPGEPQFLRRERKFRDARAGESTSGRPASTRTGRASFISKGLARRRQEEPRFWELFRSSRCRPAFGRQAA